MPAADMVVCPTGCSFNWWALLVLPGCAERAFEGAWFGVEYSALLIAVVAFVIFLYGWASADTGSANARRWARTLLALLGLVGFCAGSDALKGVVTP